MSKKILFITFHFPPYNCIGAVRTGKTVKILNELGYDVKVVTAKEQKLPKTLQLEVEEQNIYYSDWLDVNTPIYKFIGKEKVNAIKNNTNKNNFKSNLIKALKSYYIKVFHTPDQHIGWYPYAKKECRKIIEEEKWIPDIIYSSASPYTSHLIANSISSKFRIPWIAELRDLWVDNHYRDTSFFDKYLEKKTLSKAKAIVTVSNPLKNKLESKFDAPVFTIQNGFDAEDFNFKITKNSKNKINIVYTGAIYEGKRDPSILFKVISNNSELKKKVIIDFYGNHLLWIDELSEKYNIESNVNIHSPVSRKKAIEIQKTADILLLLTWNDPKEIGVLTGKLFEYIATQNTILGIGAVNDLASDIIRDNCFGIASNNKDEITNFLLNFKKGSYNTSFEQREKFNRKIQIEKLAEIIDKHAIY